MKVIAYWRGVSQYIWDYETDIRDYTCYFYSGLIADVRIYNRIGHKSVHSTFIYMHLTQGTMVDVQKKINEIMRRD